MQLTEVEDRVYGELFMLAKPAHSDVLDGWVAVNFFRKTKLCRMLLEQVELILQLMMFIIDLDYCRYR